MSLLDEEKSFRGFGKHQQPQTGRGACCRLTTRTTANKNDDDDENTRRMKEHLAGLEDLKAEREALYGFTDEDRAGWTNAHNHKHTSSFLQEIITARESAKTTVDDELLENDSEALYDDDYKTNPIHDIDTVPFSMAKIDTHHGDGNDDNDPRNKKRLSHLSKDGLSIHMVDVGDKEVTNRQAVAESRVVFPSNVWTALTEKAPLQELVGPKGPILNTAKIAGIMAAKKTSDLIPLCHPLPITSVNIDIELEESTRSAIIRCKCKVTHKTGVEMEALTGASIAALVIYDMCKAMSHDIVIEKTCLIQKSGGRRNVDKNA